MKILYVDCTSGISGDMFLGVLAGLGAEQKAQLAEDACTDASGHSHEEHHNHHNHHHDHHGRSYETVKAMIDASSAGERAKEIAKNIYGVIAEAESKVHQKTLKTVHFHEVGRDEAVLNAIKLGESIESLGIDRICCSDIYDGQGFIKCSHGEIPVPVPAVKAMMETCDFVFRRADVETEMVTPSGLAMLIGAGAEHVSSMPEGDIVAEAVCRGKRDTGLPGMKGVLIIR